MTTDDELRELIALGEKAQPRPWNISGTRAIHDRPTKYDASGARVGATARLVAKAEQDTDAAYITAAVCLAPDIARELIEARELPAKITEISELASEMWYRLVIIANDMNNWEVYLEFVDPSDEGIEGESISVYADTMIAAIDKAIRRLKCGDL